MKKLLIFLLALFLISIPVQAGKRYQYEDPTLNSEFENVYLEFGRWNKKFWDIRNAKKFKTIQDALDDLPLTGGMVFVPSGTYTITSAIQMKSNQTLIGSGFGSIITTETDNVNLIEITGVEAWPNDYNRIVIQNLKLVNKDSGTGSGIKLRKCHEVTISKVYFTKCLYGIYFHVASTYDADNNIISNCIFYNNFGAGIYARDYEWACEDNVIEGCQFVGNLRGIDIKGRINSITGNCFEESDDYNIILMNGDRNTIVGNTISQAKKHGIYIYTSDSNIIANNIIRDNDQDNTESYSGIYVRTDSDRNIIMGNICYNNDKYEIHIAHSDCDKNIVVGNCVYGSDHEDTIVDSGTGTVSEHNVVN